MPCCPSSFDQYNATEIVRHPLLSVTNGRCAAFCRSSCSLIRHLNARIIPQMSELSTKTCVPCRGGVPPLKGEDLAALEKQVDGWNVVEEHHITKTFKFPNFREALTFVNRVGELAETQGHHPDIFLAWGKVEITSWTHKINGLTESDFILAAKIDKLYQTHCASRSSQG